MSRVEKAAAFSFEWCSGKASLKCCIHYSLEGDEGMDCVAVCAKRSFQVEIVQTKDRRLRNTLYSKYFYKSSRKASVNSSKE